MSKLTRMSGKEAVSTLRKEVGSGFTASHCRNDTQIIPKNYYYAMQP